MRKIFRNILSFFSSLFGSEAEPQAAEPVSQASEAPAAEPKKRRKTATLFLVSRVQGYDIKSISIGDLVHEEDIPYGNSRVVYLDGDLLPLVAEMTCILTQGEDVIKASREVTLSAGVYTINAYFLGLKPIVFSAVVKDYEEA